MCISKQLGQDVWPCSVTLAVPTSRTFFLLFWHFQTDYVPGHWSEDWRECWPLSTYQAIVCWTGSKPLSIWTVATSTNSYTEACEHTHTHKEHDERALGQWVHSLACQACQIVLEALGRHGDPGKTNTILWLTGQMNSSEVFRHHWWILYWFSSQPEDRGLQLHLSVQKDLEDPEGGGHKANMNTFQPVAKNM